MKVISIVLILFLFSHPVFSQEENLDTMLDEILFGKNSPDSLLELSDITDAELQDLLNAMYNYKFIYVRTEFENKTYFTGKDIGIDQYNLAGQICYQGSKGLNIGIAGIMFSDFEPKYNTTELTAGYNNRVAGVKGLSVRATYSRYFFAKIDSIESSDFNSSVNTGVTYQWKGIGSSADFALLLGKESSVQFAWDIFAYIPIIKFGITNKLNIEPEVSLYFGNETIVLSQYINLPWSSREIFTEEKNFGLMNTRIRIPVSIYLGNLDISAGYNFNFPRFPGISDKPENTSFFNISVGYLFGL